MNYIKKLFKYIYNFGIEFNIARIDIKSSYDYFEFKNARMFAENILKKDNQILFRHKYINGCFCFYGTGTGPFCNDNYTDINEYCRIYWL
jgi:hypothetical protein